MDTAQAGILADLPEHARYLEMFAIPGADKAFALRKLAGLNLGEQFVIGLGPALVRELGLPLAQHRAFTSLTGVGCEIPSTQTDLWIWSRATDPGQAMHAARTCQNLLQEAFYTTHLLDGFLYKTGLDLSGYEDGTENPQGDDAIAAALYAGHDKQLSGSSFVAVQKWKHDLNAMAALSQQDQDNIIGRRQSDNLELANAPAFAHVKRTAQEDFEPEAFLLRRSMPWANETGEGLNFVAFGKSFDAFEAQMRRMAGLDDGIVDGLFRFSRPITGAYYWCPPVQNGHLNLSALAFAVQK